MATIDKDFGDLNVLVRSEGASSEQELLSNLVGQRHQIGNPDGESETWDDIPVSTILNARSQWDEESKTNRVIVTCDQ